MRFLQRSALRRSDRNRAVPLPPHALLDRTATREGSLPAKDGARRNLGGSLGCIRHGYALAAGIPGRCRRGTAPTAGHHDRCCLSTTPSPPVRTLEGLFVLGEIDEQRYQKEAAPLRARLDELERPAQTLDVEKALLYLRDVGALWADSSHQVQRKFVREVFDGIVVDGKEITSLAPKPLYAPLFVIDRQERFEGEFCSLAPRARLELAT